MLYAVHIYCCWIFYYNSTLVRFFFFFPLLFCNVSLLFLDVLTSSSSFLFSFFHFFSDFEDFACALRTAVLICIQLFSFWFIAEVEHWNYIYGHMCLCECKLKRYEFMYGWMLLRVFVCLFVCVWRSIWIHWMNNEPMSATFFVVEFIVVAAAVFLCLPSCARCTWATIRRWSRPTEMDKFIFLTKFLCAYWVQCIGDKSSWRCPETRLLFAIFFYCSVFHF